MRRPFHIVCIFLVFLLFSCLPKMIQPRDQHMAIIVSAPMKEAFLAVRPSLIKYNYQIDKADVAVGMVKGVKTRGSSNVTKEIIISVQSVDAKTSQVKINLSVTKYDVQGGCRQLSVPEKTMKELEGILNEIKHHLHQ